MRRTFQWQSQNWGRSAVISGQSGPESDILAYNIDLGEFVQIMRVHYLILYYHTFLYRVYGWQPVYVLYVCIMLLVFKQQINKVLSYLKIIFVLPRSVHSVVPITEASVIIGISSPHRNDSLEAVRYCIDTLKATVPIWKKVWTYLVVCDFCVTL